MQNSPAGNWCSSFSGDQSLTSKISFCRPAAQRRLERSGKEYLSLTTLRRNYIRFAARNRVPNGLANCVRKRMPSANSFEDSRTPFIRLLSPTSLRLGS
jgi:hypothetical protein